MDIFEKRRAAVVAKLKKPLVLKNATILSRNGAGEYHFRPENNFYYLTGYDAPDAVAVINKEGFFLFVHENDTHAEIWTGKLPSLADIRIQTNAKTVFSLKEIKQKLPPLLQGEKHVYLSRPITLKHHDQVEKDLRQALQKKKLANPTHALEGQRLKKDAHEIKSIEKAIAVTREAFLEVFKKVRPGVKEYELEAIFQYHYSMHHTAEAYPCIVASGKNALVLHYQKNGALLKKGELLLVDAGAEYNLYASDVTRTFPVSGKFSKAQKELYELVLKVNLEAIKFAKPGLRLYDVHVKAVSVLVDGLLHLGILKGNKEELIEGKKYLRFFMHNTSHWLGLDVHDCNSLKLERHVLEVGSVFTVEPGLYIPYVKEVPKKYRGIGIRIEDDVLLTKKGCRVLTAGIPKGIKEIEKAMR